MSLLSIIQNVEHSAEDVILSLQKKVASLQNTDSEKHLAFEIVTANWGTLAAEAEAILSQFTGVEGDEKDALDRLKTIVGTIRGGTQTVLNIGLNNLPDAVKTPVSSGDSPAALPSLSEPILAENVAISDAKEIVVTPKYPENVVDTATSIVKDAVDVVANEVKTSIQNDTKTDAP